MWNRTGVRSRLHGASAGLLVTLLVLALVTAVPKVTAGSAEADIRDTILRQIEAFATDDHQRAWDIASEGIQRRFGTSEVFLSMVEQAYPAIHRATAIEFREYVPHGYFDIQVVRLTGPQGARWNAYYRMVEEDGQWRIAGVRVQKADTGI
ncbi:protein of unknown function [Marinobacter daqiaonensis]|uniref:DUF4864 domain-containing protein n=1 Tax=Marinobacter daqiaonensis TaxID=650891 RepID=A0A1I6I5H7_9GAMM|nr:DUF4864 domain-containing protein [Marinobacter daqiaonensis]SFR61996.1 protein of unknown function [Marinobacter daqiaonensis]